MARFASQKRHTTSIMHRFKFRLTCRAKDALFMHRAIMSSMDQVLLLCPRPLISLYVSIWASPLDLWYPRPRFRAWTGGGGSAGGYNAPGLPNIQGVSSGDNCLTTHVLSIGPVWTGPLRVGYNLESAGEVYERRANPYEGLYGGMQFDASRANAIYGASPTVMPPSVNVPCITYLGLPA